MDLFKPWLILVFSVIALTVGVVILSHSVKAWRERNKRRERRRERRRRGLGIDLFDDAMDQGPDAKV